MTRGYNLAGLFSACCADGGASVVRCRSTISRLGAWRDGKAWPPRAARCSAAALTELRRLAAVAVLGRGGNGGTDAWERRTPPAALRGGERAGRSLPAGAGSKAVHALGAARSSCPALALGAF